MTIIDDAQIRMRRVMNCQICDDPNFCDSCRVEIRAMQLEMETEKRKRYPNYYRGDFGAANQTITTVGLLTLVFPSTVADL